MIFSRQLTVFNTAARVTRFWGGRLHYRYLTWKSNFVTEERAHSPHTSLRDFLL